MRSIAVSSASSSPPLPASTVSAFIADPHGYFPPTPNPTTARPNAIITSALPPSPRAGAPTHTTDPTKATAVVKVIAARTPRRPSTRYPMALCPVMAPAKTADFTALSAQEERGAERDRTRRAGAMMARLYWIEKLEMSEMREAWGWAAVAAAGPSVGPLVGGGNRSASSSVD